MYMHTICVYIYIYLLREERLKIMRLEVEDSHFSEHICSKCTYIYTNIHIHT